MTQHDFNIANQLFPPTRADMNNAHLAHASNNSGATAPTTTIAGMWWFDTATKVLKLRNATNDAWLDMFSVEDGTVIQPVTIEAVPIGTEVSWPGLTAPTKWQLCDGGQLKIADYPGLYNVLGTRYNTGGETAGYFRKPDRRGRTLIGRDNMGGTAAGRVTQAVSGLDGLTLGAVGGSQYQQQHQHTDPAPTVTGDGTHTHATNFTGGMLDANSGTIYHYVLTSETPGSGKSPIYYRGFSISAADAGIVVASGGDTGSAGSGTAQNIPPAAITNWIIYTGELGSTGDGGGGTAEPTLGSLETLHFALTDETTAITTGTVLIKARMPYEFVPTALRIYLNSGCTTGTFEVSLDVGGVAALSTNATIDATERTSKTAAVPPVVSATSIADDAELEFILENAGDETAYGLKAILYGYQVLA